MRINLCISVLNDVIFLDQYIPNLKTIGLSQVIDYYSKKGLVANLPAEKPPKEVTAEVLKALS